MDYEKLSQIKKGIIQTAYKYGYTTDRTYPREKRALYDKGWLQGHCPDGLRIISGQYQLTSNAKLAYEQAKG